MCYLRMNNENEELGYLNELRVFVEKYADREVKALKALEALQQYYMKTHQYAETIRILNRLMEQCDPGEHGKILHYLQGKGRCYREIKDYPSAIANCWTGWILSSEIKLQNATRYGTLVFISNWQNCILKPVTMRMRKNMSGSPATANGNGYCCKILWTERRHWKKPKDRRMPWMQTTMQMMASKKALSRKNLCKQRMNPTRYRRLRSSGN